MLNVLKYLQIGATLIISISYFLHLFSIVSKLLLLLTVEYLRNVYLHSIIIVNALSSALTKLIYEYL